MVKVSRDSRERQTNLHELVQHLIEKSCKPQNFTFEIYSSPLHLYMNTELIDQLESHRHSDSDVKVPNSMKLSVNIAFIQIRQSFAWFHGHININSFSELDEKVRVWVRLIIVDLNISFAIALKTHTQQIRFINHLRNASNVRIYFRNIGDIPFIIFHVQTTANMDKK
jgi:hypothetical protein